MTKGALICPECEEGTLSLATRELEITHRDSSLRVLDLECYRCDRCGTETAKPEQIKRNDTRIADARRQTDGLLSGDELLRIREALGLSQSDAADLFGGGPNGFSKYERGLTVQSIPMDRLLRVAAAFPWVVDFLRAQAGVRIVCNQEETHIDMSSISLNDPLYTSKPLQGPEIIVSTPRAEASVISITRRPERKKVA